MIYDYLKEKPYIKTYMTVRPMENLSKKHIAGLGLKTKPLKKDTEIMLSVLEQDWRTKLMLAYYSMSLIPAFLLEGCLTTLIKSSFASGEVTIDQQVELKPLFKILKVYANLFSNEHLTS